MAGWQSGYAADCNSVYAGSIPTPASISEVKPSQLARVGEANAVCKALALCEPNDANPRLAAGEIGRLQCDALVSQ